MLKKLLERVGMRKHEEQPPDALGEKLKDIEWKPGDDESEESMRRLDNAGQQRDALAETAFRGRPSNPLAGED
jgi:hypothetical protein